MAGYFTPGMPTPTLPINGSQLIFAADNFLGQGLNPESVGVPFNQVSSALNIPWVAGRFYGVPDGATLAAFLTVTGTQYAYPVYIPNAVTVASLNLSVTTGQTGGAGHIGIYADNGAGYPGALVVDSGALAATSTAVSTYTPAAGSLVLPAGLYWFSSIFTASGTFPSVIAGTAIYGQGLNSSLGSDTAAHALATSGQAVTGISVAATYGALAATFPAGATLALNASTPAFAIGV